MSEVELLLVNSSDSCTMYIVQTGRGTEPRLSSNNEIC